ncbi:hypothetical protein K439DRAFT_1635311 [Ramaria rubella]|nr:hypothetical protein K439DRAFT_1635311 [Ramaria rubella]
MLQLKKNHPRAHVLLWHIKDETKLVVQLERALSSPDVNLRRPRLILIYVLNICSNFRPQCAQIKVCDGLTRTGV